MGDFFKPWRRKIGVVTLVMALASAGLWGLAQSKAKREIRAQATIDEGYGVAITPMAVQAFKYDLDRGRLGGGITIPHWAIVIPLTLFSAWLLLSTPRKPKSGPTQI